MSALKYIHISLHTNFKKLIGLINFLGMNSIELAKVNLIFEDLIYYIFFPRIESIFYERLNTFDNYF